MNKPFALLLAVVALAVCAPCRGALIINGDFSADGWASGAIVPGSSDIPNKLTSITGWTILPGSNIVGLGPNVASIPTPGLELTGWSDTIFPSGVSQILGTTAGNAYTLNFTIYDIGANISKINFSLNGSQLGTNLSAQGGSIVGGSTMGKTYTYNFTGIGSDEISFVWPGPALSTQVSILADVRVTSAPALPEPGTWAAAVLLLGAAGYVRWRRRQVA